MSEISYTRTGIIKKVGDKAIMIEMTDTGESLIWPLSESDEDSDITETLEAGEEITIQLHISDDPFSSSEPEASKKEGVESKDDEEEAAERMRKMLEELLN